MYSWLSLTHKILPALRDSAVVVEVVAVVEVAVVVVEVVVVSRAARMPCNIHLSPCSMSTLHIHSQSCTTADFPYFNMLDN